MSDTDFNFDTVLSPQADAIIERHRAQDRHRSHANRARIAEIHDIKNQEAALLKDRGYLVGFRHFPGSNATNQLTAPGKPVPKTQLETPQRSDIKAQVQSIDAAYVKLYRQREKLERLAPEPILTHARIISEVEKWRNLDVAEIERPAPELLKGERSLIDALARFRETVASLKAERKAIQKSPLPAAAVKRIAHDQIKQLAARGQPRVMGLFTGGDLELPKLLATAQNGPYFSQAIDAAALSTYLLYDLLIERVDELIDINAPAFDAPLSIAARTKKLAALDCQIDEAERIEAAAVESLVSEGREVFHRPDISVLAVLSYATR